MNRQNSLLRRKIARVMCEAVHIHQAKTGDRLEDVADALGISTGHLHNVMVAERDAPLPADLVVRMARELGDFSVLEALGDLCEVGRERSGVSVVAAVTEAGEVGQIAMALVGDFLRAVADGVVSREELAGLEVSAPRVSAALAGLVGLAGRMARGGCAPRAGSLAEAEEFNAKAQRGEGAKEEGERMGRGGR